MLDISDLAGSASHCDYTAIPQFCEEAAIKAYVAETRRRFAEVAKRFDNDLHTQWLVRNYQALKLILGATVLSSSAEHAETENLQITLPYLNYYTLLNCARAVVFTLPDPGGATSCGAPRTTGNCSPTASRGSGPPWSARRCCRWRTRRTSRAF